MRFFKIFTLLTFLLLQIFILPEKNQAQSKKAKKALETLEKLDFSFRVLSEKISPAVVQVRSLTYSPGKGMVRSSSELLTREFRTGSGVILTPDGYIVTNAHVVIGAKRIQVILPRSKKFPYQPKSILKASGRRVLAQLVGLDHETDLALLKIEEQHLPFLRLADSDEVHQGQLVFAFGSPMGLENSVSMGVVSSTARQLHPEAPMIYIQTDAPINPGNSGGPLVNVHGDVIGINTFIFSQSGGSEGLGFAAPSNIVKNVVNQLQKMGHVRRGEIGVYAQTINHELAEGLGLPQDWGVILGDVFPQRPAQMAGLKVGDIVLTLDGKVMENGRQFDVNLYRHAIGDQVTLVVLRGTDTLSVTVRVIEREDDPERFADLVSSEHNLVPELGILALDIDAKIAQMIPLRKQSGVLVASRAIDIPYYQQGLLPGDIIYSLNNHPVTNLKGLRELLAKMEVYQPMVFQIQRRNQLMYISFEKQ